MEYKELYKEVTKRLNEIEDPEDLTDIDMMNILTNLRLCYHALFKDGMMTSDNLLWIYSEKITIPYLHGKLDPEIPLYRGLEKLSRSVHNIYKENLDNYMKKISNEDFSESLINKLKEFEKNNTNSGYVGEYNINKRIFRELNHWGRCIKEFNSVGMYNDLSHELEEKLLKYYNELIPNIKKNIYGYDSCRMIKNSYKRVN